MGAAGTRSVPTSEGAGSAIRRPDRQPGQEFSSRALAAAQRPTSSAAWPCCPEPGSGLGQPSWCGPMQAAGLATLSAVSFEATAPRRWSAGPWQPCWVVRRRWMPAARCAGCAPIPGLEPGGATKCSVGARAGCTRCSIFGLVLLLYALTPMADCAHSLGSWRSLGGMSREWQPSC